MIAVTASPLKPGQIIQSAAEVVAAIVMQGGGAKFQFRKHGSEVWEGTDGEWSFNSLHIGMYRMMPDQEPAGEKQVEWIELTPVAALRLLAGHGQCVKCQFRTIDDSGKVEWVDGGLDGVVLCADEPFLSTGDDAPAVQWRSMCRVDARAIKAIATTPG